jgi:hypothetical protein
MMASIAEDTRAGINDLSSAAGRGLAFASVIKRRIPLQPNYPGEHFLTICHQASQSKTVFASPAILAQVPPDFAEREVDPPVCSRGRCVFRRAGSNL